MWLHYDLLEDSCDPTFSSKVATLVLETIEISETMKLNDEKNCSHTDFVSESKYAFIWMFVVESRISGHFSRRQSN